MNHRLVRFLLLLLMNYAALDDTRALKVTGGKTEDVVVMEYGSGPGEMLSYRVGPFDGHPDAFDIDREENIYVQDPGNGPIQVFSKNGAFLRELKLNRLLKHRANVGNQLDGLDIAVGGSGIIYMIDFPDKSYPTYKRLVQFSKAGEFVKHIPVPETGQFGPITVYSDFSDNLYLYQEVASCVFVYDKKLRNIGSFWVSRGPTECANFAVNKFDEKGRIYMLWDQYPFVRRMHVYMCDIQAIKGGTTLDSVKLPDELEGDSIGLIGYDLSDNLYFLIRGNRWLGDTEAIIKYHIRGKGLVKTGEITLDYSIDLKKEELENKASMFVKRYVVANDGHIYFLHGTIRKMYVSKLTFIY